MTSEKPIPYGFEIPPAEWDEKKSGKLQKQGQNARTAAPSSWGSSLHRKKHAELKKKKIMLRTTSIPGEIKNQIRPGEEYGRFSESRDIKDIKY